MTYVPSASIASAKGRSGRTQKDLAAPGMLLGKVIHANAALGTVDLVLGQNQGFLYDVRVAQSSASTRTGTFYLPSISNVLTGEINSIGRAIGSYANDGQRQVYAVIQHVMDDPSQPIVTGFIYPNSGQMMHAVPGMRIERHETDTYSMTRPGPQSSYDPATDTTLAEYEWVHSDGSYMRLGQGTAHRDLSAQDAQGRWLVRGTTNANASLGTPGPNTADRTDAVFSHSSGAYHWIDQAGNIKVGSAPARTMTLNTATIDTSGNIGTSGTLSAAALSVPQGKIAKVQLAYAPTTDLFNGTTITSATWTDLCANQTFTVDQATSTIEVQSGGSCSVEPTTGGASANCGARVLIDNTTAYYIGGNWVGSAVFANTLAGAVPAFITGLSAGNHTVKVQIFMQCNTGNGIAYCRCSASATTGECFRLNIIEHKY